MVFNKNYLYSLNNKGELHESHHSTISNSHIRCYYKFQTLVFEGEILYLHLLYKRGYCNLKDLELIYSKDIIVKQMLFQYLKDKYERIKKYKKEKKSIRKS
jgi:hypothetical protein